MRLPDAQTLPKGVHRFPQRNKNETARCAYTRHVSVDRGSSAQTHASPHHCSHACDRCCNPMQGLPLLGLRWQRAESAAMRAALGQAPEAGNTGVCTRAVAGACIHAGAGAGTGHACTRVQGQRQRQA
eukprot:366293-Chlamydomonas_euryale.AAC.4